MNRPAPLTKAAYGSTRCPSCEKRFADTPRPTVDIEGTEENRGRIDSIGQRHRGIGRHAVTRRWHADCLSEFEAQNEAYRRQVAADQEETARAICAAAGLDFEEVMAKIRQREEEERLAD
jgi:hypothetical protein